jgi:hypothetical protein
MGKVKKQSSKLPSKLLSKPSSELSSFNEIPGVSVVFGAPDGDEEKSYICVRDCPFQTTQKKTLRSHFKACQLFLDIANQIKNGNIINYSDTWLKIVSSSGSSASTITNYNSGIEGVGVESYGSYSGANQDGNTFILFRIF